MKNLKDESLLQLKSAYEALKTGPFTNETLNEILTNGTHAIEHRYKNQNNTAANLVRLDALTQGDVLYLQTATFDAFHLAASDFVRFNHAGR